MQQTYRPKKPINSTLSLSIDWSVFAREKAALGSFATPAEPTRAMKEGAAAFGFYESLGTTIFPKLQILTIKGLLDGTNTARYPDLTRGGLTFKKAKKETTDEQDRLFRTKE